MMGAKSVTKQKIIEAAISLFNTKGYDGTSVRDIAKTAKMNAANISYYFSSKQGLLEYLITDFLEGYTHILERTFEKADTLSSKEMLLIIVRDIIAYQSNHRQLTRFFYREISLDSILIREIMTTYLMREKYFFKTIMQMGIKAGEFRNTPFPIFMVQLKGMLNIPYLYPQYIAEVLHVLPSDSYFTAKYTKELEEWIEQHVCVSAATSFEDKLPAVLSVWK
ncbi:forespore capture DNA-binding protein RefZ [Bacillus sp. 165]|uniref:forespore capture DNA-binding protein RefZ n=1 Tax=Bacillus sp. 165 TaxID=1529117 RepID=UPI001AD95504|nr:forespore capture DNA-binding protein RefZ [Bacillus sp. 165]MBO9131205.1 forespore capture DNA-binding protein RefZ [Bacillus sp. 165]